jgi:ABC-type transporter MlaC component
MASVGPLFDRNPAPAFAVPLARLAVAASLALFSATTVLAQSALLDSVKNNPARARAICEQLKQLNSQGLTSTSPQAVAVIARQQNLNPVDAEVLATYVVGMYCPDVR